MPDLDLTILMPCLNEAETLAICVRQAVAAIRDANVSGEVLVADNGSTDGSQQIAIAEGARVVDVPTRGYGAALIAGIESARGKYILMADADASYHFEHLPRFLPKLDAGYDLVMGNRFAGSIEPGAMPPLHRFLGNPVLSAVGRIFFGIPVRDFHCGLRAFRRDSILALNLRTTGMEFASEMVVKSSLAGLRMTEVPTTLSPDGRSRPPHLRSWRDGWRHLRFLLLYSPRWLFFYPGLIALAAGVTLSIALLPGPLVLHFGATTRTLDVDTLTYALGLVLIGTHITVFAVSAKIFGTLEGFLPPNPRLERLFKFVTLETGLLLGCVLLFIGAGTLGYALYLWHATGYGNLSPTSTLRITLPSATAFMLGVEVIFASFFLSLLGLNRR
jgi:glycosyltransferase involved in cell wall biosynthesis